MKKKIKILSIVTAICICATLFQPLQVQAAAKPVKSKISVSYKKFADGVVVTYKNKNKCAVKLTAKLSFKDADGTVLSTEKEINNCLGASRTAAVYFKAPVDSYGNTIPFVSYKASFSIKKSNRKDCSKKIYLTKDIQTTQAAFTAINLSGKKLSKIQATIVFRDSNNAIIYSCTKYLNCYEPDQNMLFNVEYPEGMIRPGKVTVYMNYAY